MTLPDRLRGERSEAGETLLEVLIAAVLLGLVVVAVVGGLATTVVGSHVHRRQADANAILVSAMERIKSSDFGFSNVDCAATATARRDAYEVQARGVALPAGWSPTAITLSSLRFEAMTMAAGVANVSFVPAADTVVPDPATYCSSGLHRQLVTLKLTSPDSKVSQSLSFIKGDV
jgi:Tfp pilus assembly protein PilV